MCLHEYVITCTNQGTAVTLGGECEVNVAAWADLSAAHPLFLLTSVKLHDVCLVFFGFFMKLTFASFSPSSRFTTLLCVESAWNSLEKTISC